MRVDGSTSMRRNVRERPEAGPIACNTIRDLIIEVGTTVFRFAPNEPNPDRSPCRCCAFCRRAAACCCDRNQFLVSCLTIGEQSRKNTGDLQWEKRGNYNATPCSTTRKPGGAGTMDINGKTIRRTMETMETMENTRRVVTPEDTQWVCARVAGRRIAAATSRACKAKRARGGEAPDARMSLCTYCHAPLAPEMQAGFDLSPLFAGAPIMAVAATAAAARRDGSTAPRPSASGLPDPSANGKVGPHR